MGRLPRLIEYSRDDFITTLAVSAKQFKDDLTPPAHVMVRMIRVEARVRGKFQSMRLVTSLLDARRYPASEIAGRVVAQACGLS